MRYVRFALFVLVLLFLATFFFQNYESLNIDILIRFNLLGLLTLDPVPIGIWQIVLGTAVIVALVTLAYNLAQLLGLRGDLWKRDRELRQLKSALEDQENEVKRLRAQAGMGGSYASTAAAPDRPALGEGNGQDEPDSEGERPPATKVPF